MQWHGSGVGHTADNVGNRMKTRKQTASSDVIVGNGRTDVNFDLI
jgi:hypothetical protein